MVDDPKKQLLAVKIAVAFIALAILVIWSINLRYVWRNSAQEADANSQSGLSSFSEELGDALEQLNKNLEDIKVATTTEVIAPPAQTNVVEERSADEILKDTMKNIGSTTNEIPVLPASTTMPAKDTSGCPAWVNCMPTIGGPPVNCGVPSGCEGVTELVY